MPRLGFLAVTFGDGVCRVFDVPDPNAFESKEENFPIFGKSHLKIADELNLMNMCHKSSMP